MGMGGSVILEGFVLGRKTDQLGLYGELAVHVADVVIARDVPSVCRLDRNLQSVVCSVLRGVGDRGIGGYEGGLAVGDPFVGGDGKGLADVRCSVVDPMAVRGGHGDRSLLYGDRRLGYEYRVVFGDVSFALIVNIKQQQVFHGADVGDPRAACHRGDVAFHQRRAIRDKEFLISLGGSRVFQRSALHVDLYGVFMHRELTRSQCDPVVGGHVQIVKADDLDLRGVGNASRIRNGIPEGGDQSIR